MSPVRIVTPTGMKEADRRTIAEARVPGMVLMENAARSVVDFVRERWSGARKIEVVCGGGNNGGDGLAVARILHSSGWCVRALLLVPPEKLSGDAAHQLEIARNFGTDVEVVTSKKQLVSIRGATHLIDAILGTGFSRPPAGLVRDAILAIRQAGERDGAAVLAIDIPSGLDGSTGRLPGLHVRADLTVTFGAAKWAHVLSDASLACGEVVVADIGIPDRVFEENSSSVEEPIAEIYDQERFLLTIARRPRGAHKGVFGHLLLVAGGRGQAGAAVLAARGALRSGVGLLTLAVPEGLAAVFHESVPEAMLVSLPQGRDGRLALGCVPLLLHAAKGKSAVAAGPGLGTGEGCVAAVEALSKFAGPAVFDADALNLLAVRGPRKLRNSAGPRILTPHPGEAARLLGRSGSKEIQDDRPRSALRLAKQWNAVAILKGDGSLIAAPEGDLVWNPTGNPGMSRGGSGDVLCGVAGSFLARGIEPFEAACAAAFLHGAAGDLAAEQRGEEGMTSGDLPDAIARILSSLGR